MKYIINSGNKNYTVELLKSGKHQAGFLINGKSIVVEKTAGNIIIDGKSMEYSISFDSEGLPNLVKLNDKEIPVSFETVGEGIALRRRKKIKSKEDNVVTAPINGTVVRIVAKEGKKISKGDTVLILEAMKMENEVASPLSGVIKKIDVKEGQAVKSGDILFEIQK